MSVLGAFTQLNTWTVGTATNKGFVDQPPANVPSLVLEFQRGLDRRELSGALTVDWATYRAVVYAKHSLLIAAITAPLVQKWDDILTGIDDYLAVVAGDSRLAGNLDQPIEIIDIEAGEVVVQGGAYLGVQFTLRMVVDVS